MCIRDRYMGKKAAKIPSPKSKDHPNVAISHIEWSHDSNFLLVSYQQINKLILWHVDTCERRFELEVSDKSFLKAQLYPYNPHVAIVSCAQPYLVDIKTGESARFLAEQEEEKMAVGEEKSAGEEWLVLGLSKEKRHFFLLVSPKNQVILLKERVGEMEDDAHKEISAFINTEKFVVVTVLSLTVNGKISSIVANDDQSFILLNASDRCLRLVQIDYQQKELILQKECSDVINRKKWMAMNFFTIGHPEKKQYIVSGVGESGSHDICFMSMDDSNKEERLGPSKEGCMHLCGHCTYHNSIAVVSSNGDVLLWSVKNPKSWTALAPDFTEIEENIEYVEKEDEFDYPNTIYIPPVTDPEEVVPVETVSNYFDVDQGIEVYSDYSRFECLKHGSSYKPKANLVMVKLAIAPNFLTTKVKEDVKKLKEKMKAKGIFPAEKSDGGVIEIAD
eukprot:TRINITY_DN11006_c0_g1_i1.p1 TRINITY_DN11006_c0_g1~~TRINITY_DN11006_c0_g1_i1.p1  ORF type:complete len:447 (+),score=120.13 TRINITY_DN11006_c0_g1_i1:78-1418(+)